MAVDYETAKRLYEILEKEADKDLWEGSMAASYGKLGASQAQYTRLFHLLTESGCIEILRKGRAGLQSQIRLIQRPQEGMIERVLANPLTGVDSSDTVSVEQRVGQLETSLREGMVGSIDVGKALANIEQRLQRLESSNGKTTQERKSTSKRTSG